MTKSSNIILLLFILLNGLCCAQTPFFKNFRVNDGLPSDEVYHSMQDSKGFLWFSTNAGVSRFDGYTFVNFSTENGLPDNVIFESYEDPKGRIWFRSFSGKLSYYYNDSIYKLSNNAELVKYVEAGFINSICVDHTDTLWLGISNAKTAIIKLSLKGTKEKFIPQKIRSAFYYIYYFADGLVYGQNFQWKNSSTKQMILTLAEKNGKSRQLDILTHNSSKLSSYINTFCKRLKDGSFIFLGNNAVIHLASCGVLSQTERPYSYCFLQDKDQNLWIGGKDGVTYYPSGDLASKDAARYLEKSDISSVLQDAENGTWITTLDQGIYHLRSREFLTYNDNAGLSFSKINCISADERKNIWVGLANGNIDIISPDKITHYKPGNGLQGASCISSLNPAKNGSMMIMGVNIDSFKKAGNKQKINVMSYPVSKGIESIYGGLWTFDNARLTLRSMDKAFSILLTVKLKSRANNFFEDHTGLLWLGSLDGLWSYDRKNLRYWGDEFPLLKNRITDIKEAADHSLWLTTKDKGVLIKKNNTIEQINTGQGLVSNNCNSLFIGPDNIVWVGTQNGISKIEVSNGVPKHYIVTNYNDVNGLHAKEIKQLIKVKDKLWARSNEGITVFDPDKVKVHASYSPPVYITEVSVNGSKITNEIKLAYDQNYITFKYIGISFKNPGKILYKYRLSGVDINWKYTHNNSIQYTTLPPGQYKFTLYANSNGVESSIPATFFFHIAPPFWNTWWFILIAICTCSAIIFMLFKQHEKQNKLQQKATKNELKALRAQMNPHFIFNSINAIQSFIIENDASSSQKFLSKFAKLIRYVLNRSDFILIPVEEEINGLKIYLELESVRLSNKFSYSIEIAPEIDSMMEIPSMLIQPYIENAIWHGFTNATKNGKILVQFSLINNSIKCVIKDNGIGRKKASELKSRYSVNHRSVGMAITKERLKIINSLRKNKLNMNITDLYDTFGNPTGTLVELFIPLN